MISDIFRIGVAEDGIAGNVGYDDVVWLHLRVDQLGVYLIALNYRYFLCRLIEDVYAIQ